MGPTEQNTTNAAPSASPQPVPPQQPMMQQAPAPQAVLPVKKSKKGLIIGLVVALVAILGLAGGVLTYAFVYNNPENALLDAMTKSMAAKSSEVKGAMTIKANGAETKAEFTMSTNEAGQSMMDESINVAAAGQNATLKMHAASTNDALYLKIDDLRALIKKMSGDAVTEDMMAIIEEYYGSLLDKIDGKWVVIKLSDIEDLSNGEVKASQLTCVQTQFDKIRTDNSVRSELIELYKKNRFIKIESKGSDSNGNRYSLSVDQTAAKAYAESLVNSAFFKSVDACVDGKLKESIDTSKTSTKTSTNDPTVTADVWVDGWSHEFKKIAFTAKDSTTEMTYELFPKYNTKPTVTIPEGQTTVNDLKTEIEGLQEMFQPTISPTYSPYNYDDYSF